jgi:hypothetical protein
LSDLELNQLIGVRSVKVLEGSCLRIPAALFHRKYLSPKRDQVSRGALVVPRVHLSVESIAQGKVKLIFVSCLEHQAEVVAIGPVALGADLLLHPVEECCAGKRI